VVARGIDEAAGFAPSVVTIGKFDGVHAGHAHLIRQVVAQAAQNGLTPSVLTFDPHPLCVLAPDRAPKPLASVEERCDRMRELGIEQIFVLRFTLDIARLSPEEFVTQYLRDVMRARFVWVGDNFRFGHRQSGDPALLAALGEQYGFETRRLDPVQWRGLAVSTSEVRTRIEAGEVSLAGRLLERPYALTGDVVPGHGVGSKQTVPTLNLRTEAPVLPRNGVYISRTTDPESGRRWNSITNIGVRPTFGGDALTIETFLLDPFDGVTPARIRVDFLRRVRGEHKFESPEALKRQILHDVGRAQAYFRRLARWACEVSK
jgi:riboflavin kinase/FMN adenylyltransferase